MIAALRTALTLILAIALVDSSAPLEGRFALQSGDVKTQGHFRATPLARDPLARRLDFWFTHGSETIRRYDVDMTKYLHLVVISADFRTFLHLHPALSADGHFRLEQRFPKAAIYHLYADGDPHGIGQQVFRYDLTVGTPPSEGAGAVAPRGNVVRAGPYTVSLAPTRLRAGKETAIVIHVRERNAPAKLRPYLGAPAHAVFIDASDLTYVHVHPMPLGPGANAATPQTGAMQMDSPEPAAASPDMLLHVAVREAGTYRLWLEFRGSDGVHAAAFVVTAT